MNAPARSAPSVALRAMRREDVPDADNIFRLAFGSEFGLADPMSFRGDGSVVGFRQSIFPDGAIVAVIEDRIAGLSIASRWSSVGFLGPVCVHPDFWRHGIARQLVRASVEQLDRWGCEATGLFTNPSSPRHVRLYQEFGFWPRALTVLMSRSTADAASPAGVVALSGRPGDRESFIARARRAADRIHPGLDLSAEIAGVVNEGKGDVLFLQNPDGDDFAICHFGPGSEGSSALFYVKYAQVTPGANAAVRFARLVDACLAHARQTGFAVIHAGVSTRQMEAYRILLDAGFRGEMHGLRMHRPLVETIDDARHYVVSDWR